MNAIATPMKRHLRDTTLTIRGWGPEAESALGLITKYLERLHLNDGSTRVVTWSVLTLADVVKTADTSTGRVALPLTRPAGKKQALPRLEGLPSRSRIMVVGWSPEADAALEYIRRWAAKDLKVEMSGNKVATWAVLTLGDLIRYDWVGKEVVLPTAETARWEGFRRL
jgi:hypothetical protein